jgi:hypothetical protein
LYSDDVNPQRPSGTDESLVRRTPNGTNVLDRFEAVVQNCVRAAPIVFDKASGSELFDDSGKRYIDFHSAGGSQGFGHNNLKVCSALIDYLCNDRVIQTCERKSVAKRTFVEIFANKVLLPLNLGHKLLFTDPASGVATEVALRIARRHKKRSGVIAFTNVALWRDEEGFDILINWGRSDEQSLRAEGAQVSGDAPSSVFVHLMVAYADGELEHFLFDLDESGAGELLRTAAPDAPAASPSESIATCLKPR